MRVRPLILVLLAAAIVLAGGIMVGRLQKASAPSSDMKKETITLKGVALTVDVATTPHEQERGLAGRRALGANEGMLFVFPADGKYAFWMKDMSFAIDILWLDTSGTVVFIVPDLSPDTYPKAYAPSAPARFVLELPAGWAAAHRAKIGDAASF